MQFKFLTLQLHARKGQIPHLLSSSNDQTLGFAPQEGCRPFENDWCFSNNAHSKWVNDINGNDNNSYYYNNFFLYWLCYFCFLCLAYVEEWSPNWFSFAEGDFYAHYHRKLFVGDIYFIHHVHMLWVKSVLWCFVDLL